MESTRLTGLNLNLLVALDSLLSERNVTRAARRIGITQPAMSQTLARLRELFGEFTDVSRAWRIRFWCVGGGSWC